MSHSSTSKPKGYWQDIARHFMTTNFDCGWSLLSHGVAEGKSLHLGNLNPIYERELTMLDVHQGEGRWNVSKDGSRRKGCRHR